LSLEGLLHCLKAHQRLPHDGLHSSEEGCIHGDEARKEARAMLFWKSKLVSREVGALRWELGGPRLANHLIVLELLLGICPQRRSIGFRPSPPVNERCLVFLRQTTYFRLHPKLKAYHTAKMPDIEMPDPEELGGLVTKPFKFVTGSYLDRPQT
jgi:hypothetical protein